MSSPLVSACLLAALALQPEAPAVPEGLNPPQMLDIPDVAYPASLLEQDEPPEGTVVVRYTVGIEGQIESASIAESVHPDLDRIALETLMRSSHVAATFEGEPVVVTTKAAFRFEPPPRGEPESKPVLEAPALEPEVVPPPISATGQLLEAGLRTPVVGATIVAIPGNGLPLGRVSRRDAKAWHDANPDKLRHDGESEAASDRLPVSTLGDPSKAVRNKEILDAVEASLDQLSEKHRMVIVMRELQGLSYADMAKAMNCSKGTIMSRLFHARRNMQKLLKDRLDHVPTTSDGGTDDGGPDDGGSPGGAKKRGRKAASKAAPKGGSETNTSPSGSVTQEAAS